MSRIRPPNLYVRTRGARALRPAGRFDPSTATNVVIALSVDDKLAIVVAKVDAGLVGDFVIVAAAATGVVLEVFAAVAATVALDVAESGLRLGVAPQGIARWFRPSLRR